MPRRPLLDAAPSLIRRAPEDARERLRDLRVGTVEVPSGGFDPAAVTPSAALGFLISRGMIARSVEVSGGSSVELLSAGDLLQPDAAEQSSFAQVSWTALEALELIIVDDEMIRRISGEPEVLAELMSRGTRRAHNITVSAAIESVVGVENRVLLALWQLAENYGEVSPEGVRLSLRLTHEMLSHLVGSRRPSVTSALSALGDRNLVTRLPDRSWLLKGCPPGP